MKQIIISVGREFGSGGHIVAQKIAEHYDIPIFNIWRYETAPHKMLSSAFAQFFQSCPYWFTPAKPDDPVSVPPQYEAFFNSSGTSSHYITIPLFFSPSAPKM